MFRAVRFGCLLTSLISLIPLALLAVFVLVAASLFGLLPSGVNSYVLGGERFVAGRIIDLELSGQALSLRSLDAAPVKGGLAITVAINSSNQLPSDVPKPVALIAFRVLANHLGEPVGIGNAVASIRLQIWGPGWTKPALDVVVTKADLIAWQNGKLSDAQFEQRWKAP
jgi:hypothetical protein